LPFVLDSLDLGHLAPYDNSMVNNHGVSLASVLRQKRISLLLTIGELAAKSGVSESHLSRIERGERFPSASILQKIAKPLGFDEDELFMLAGFLSRRPSTITESNLAPSSRGLDPYVANLLAQEPVAIQRAVVGILSILKSLSKNTPKE
jgi:transcriptional regulator with XRE-family HTH domain